MINSSDEEIEQLKKLNFQKFASVPFLYSDEMLRLLEIVVPKYLTLVEDYIKLSKTLEKKNDIKVFVPSDFLALEIDHLHKLEIQVSELKQIYIKEHDKWIAEQPKTKTEKTKVGFWKRLWNYAT